MKDIQVTVDFYESILGMQKFVFGDNRLALRFGQQKINLHEAGNEFEPKARNVQSGSADMCFVTAVPIDDVITHIEACGVLIIEGPVSRSGAKGEIVSVYLRDPDGNLIEISNYIGI